MTGDLTFSLQEFTKDRKFKPQRTAQRLRQPVTQQARNAGLPLDSEKLTTPEGEERFRKPTKSAVKPIPVARRIERVLAAPGRSLSATEASRQQQRVRLHFVEQDPQRQFSLVDPR